MSNTSWLRASILLRLPVWVELLHEWLPASLVFLVNKSAGLRP